MKSNIKKYCYSVSSWFPTFGYVAIGALFLTGVTPVAAEESVIISLHEQIGLGVEEMKQGFEQLATETPAMTEAKVRAKQARELPVDSQAFAHARAQYVAARSQDLEFRAMTVKQTYKATSNLTDLVDRLIEVQMNTVNGRDSVLGGKTEEVIRKKAQALQGIDRMMAAIIRSGDDPSSRKLKLVQQAFQVKMKAAIQIANLNTGTGIEKLTALRDTTEGLAYLMRAYADGLELQQYGLTFLAIHGEADAVFRDASEVIEAALSMLDTDSFDFEDDNFFIDSLDTGESPIYGNDPYRNTMVDSIGSAAENLIARQR